MSNVNDLIFLPSFSLEPNKCTSFNRVFKKSKLSPIPYDGANPLRDKIVWNSRLVNHNSIKRSTHNFEISENAYRTLKKKINWLYYLSKARYVKTYSGKEIFNFKIAFVTLTLPSTQKTCTKDVTQNLFNTLLTEIRQRTNMTNYVWRLEFQKNGNVHYHIVTDTYLDYFFVQKIWNRILKNHGYIADYQSKFANMSLHEYNQTVNASKKVDFSIIAKRYAKAKASNWEQPNSVDVKSVVSKQKIANYISKYFSKDSKSKTIKNALDNDENSKNLRLWFCSRSLSKLNSVSNFCEAVEYDIFSVIKACKDFRQKNLRFATMYFFDLNKMLHWSRSFIEQLLRNYAKECLYQPSQ